MNSLVAVTDNPAFCLQSNYSETNLKTPVCVCLIKLDIGKQCLLPRQLMKQHHPNSLIYKTRSQIINNIEVSAHENDPNLEGVSFKNELTNTNDIL